MSSIATPPVQQAAVLWEAMRTVGGSKRTSCSFRQCKDDPDAILKVGATRDEVKVHAGLTPHKHILNAAKVNSTTLRMPLQRGGDLHTAILTSTWRPEVHAAPLWRQVAAGVVHLHAVCNVVHTDLKAENVLLSHLVGLGVDAPLPTAVICDFGDAARLPAPTAQPRGTLVNLAPEWAQHEEAGAGATHAAMQLTHVDEWTMGLLALAMWTQRGFMTAEHVHGWCMMTYDAIQEQIDHKLRRVWQYKHGTRTPQAWRAVIASLLRARPQERIALATALVATAPPAAAAQQQQQQCKTKK